MLKEKLKGKAAIIISGIAGGAVMIYFLFFAFIPSLGLYAMSDTKEITEAQALSECPEIALTDYDRQFIDKILKDPRIQALEIDAEKEQKYQSICMTADDAGFERYALRPEENYTVNADYSVYGICPLHASADFERTEGLYGKDLYISADNEEYTDDKDNYVKVITITRSDGKFIAEYWYFHGKYKKETFRYGLISYAELMFHALMSV